MDDKIKLLELWDKAGGDIYVYADLVAEHEREKNKDAEKEKTHDPIPE